MNNNTQNQSALGDILRGNDDAAHRVGGDTVRDETHVITTEDFGCFGWLHSTHERADMLELRLKSGRIGVIPYGWIEFIEFDPSLGIKLDARGTSFQIKGRHLNSACREGVRLFEGIVSRRVTWIREYDRAGSIETHDGATVVASIDW